MNNEVCFIFVFCGLFFFGFGFFSFFFDVVNSNNFFKSDVIGLCYFFLFIIPGAVHGYLAICSPIRTTQVMYRLIAGGSFCQNSADRYCSLLMFNPF